MRNTSTPWNTSPALGGLLVKALAAGALLLALSGCIPIPVFEFTPSNPVIDETVTFDGTGSIVSNIPEGTVAVSYRWNFGDGTSASGASSEHSYDTAGTYEVTLRVIDSAGRVGETQETITVEKKTDTTGTTSTELDEATTTQ